MSIVTNDNDNIAGFYPTTPSRSFSDDTVSRAARYQQHCANGDRPSQWEMVNFGPYKIQTLQPIAKKIVTVDYSHETNHYANLGANPSMGRAFGQMGEI